MLHVRRNDIVQVISGNDRGKTGKVLRVDRARNRILVEGVRFVTKHLRRSQQHPHGARIKKEAPVDASNVRLVCQSCDKPTRVVWKSLEEGKRVRICLDTYPVEPS